MKKHFPKLLLLLALVAAILLLMAARSTYGVKSIRRDPFGQIEKSLNKTKSIIQQDMLFSVPTDIVQSLRGGAVDISFAGADNTSAAGRLYLRENAFALMNATAKQGKETLDFNFWMTQTDVALQLQQGEENGIYGLNLQTLNNDLRGSDLLTVAGVTYEEIAPYLDALNDMPTQDEEENTDLRTLLATRSALQELLKSSSCSVSEATISMDVGDIETFRVSLGLTAAHLCDAVDIYLEWFVTTRAYQNMQLNEPESLQKLEKSAEALKQEITDTNASMMIDFYLHTQTEVILRANLRIDRLVGQQAATLYATIDLGSNPVNSALYSIKIGSEDPQEGKNSYTIEYHRTHTHNLPTRKLIVSNKEETITVFDLHKNELTNAFDLMLMDDEYAIRGTSVMQNNARTIILDMGGGNTLSIAFILDAEIPEMPAYRNLCFIPRKELEELLPEMEDEPGGSILPDLGCSVELLVMGSDQVARYFQVYSEYETLGQFLVEEGVAHLDEQGRISKILACDYFSGLPDGATELAGAPWALYINDELYEGSLYDVVLDTDIFVSIFASGSGS